jgi:hypothetical protein
MFPLGPFPMGLVVCNNFDIELRVAAQDFLELQAYTLKRLSRKKTPWVRTGGSKGG